MIFWLTSFAMMAQWTSVYNGWWYGEGDSYGFWDAPFRPEDLGLAKRTIVRRSTNKYHAGVALAGTAAGLSAVELYVQNPEVQRTSRILTSSLAYSTP